MNELFAKKLGKAYRLGIAFSMGMGNNDSSLAMDEDKWITIYPNGKFNAKGEKNKGQPVLLGENGVVKGGMGGKFNGEHIGQIKDHGTSAVKNKGKKTRKFSVDLSLPNSLPEGLIMQNRNRNSKASVKQMMNISKNPEYGLLEANRQFSNGAPVIAFGKIPENQLGKEVSVLLPTGEKVNVIYAVVDANSVLTSNDITGASNKEYEKDDPTRSRAIAGNGRITGLAEAYKQGNAGNYKAELLDDSERIGVSKKVIQSLKSPIVVKVMQPKDVTKDIGDKSNISTGLQMSAVEVANNDKNRVKVSELEFDPYGNPSIDSIKSFVSRMPESEQGNLIDEEGYPTKQAKDRLIAATIASAYENNGLTKRFSQALDSESSNLINALAMASPKVSRLEGLPDGYDLRDVISHAAERVLNAKRSGRSLEDEAKQISLIGKKEDDEASSYIVDIISKNLRSPRAIAEKLGDVADNLVSEAKKQGYDLFGEVKKLSKLDILRSAARDGKQNSLSLDSSFEARKMSVEAVDFWNKNGGRFFKAVFSGSPVPRTFFDDLRIALT